MSDSSFKLGVDGGGTKTEFILVDATGAIVATHIGPGCNPSQVGPDRARQILHEGLQALLQALPRNGDEWRASSADKSRPHSGAERDRPPISATMLFMAGSPPFWAETAAALTGFGTVTTATDSLPVLELATGGAPGLVLHAGTGSFVAARATDGSTHYAGGLGWKLGDAGSGFDLGRRAIAGALLELQGWPSGGAQGGPVRQAQGGLPVGAKTLSPLAAALCAHTGLADYAANSRFFYADAGANAAISAFAPRVLELAEQDCGPAQQVVADSVTDLARLADQVIHQLFPAGPAEPPSGLAPRNRDEWRASSADASRAASTPQRDRSPVSGFPREALLPCGVSGRILNSVPAAFALRSLATKLRWPVKLEFITTPPREGVRRLLAAGGEAPRNLKPET